MDNKNGSAFTPFLVLIMVFGIAFIAIRYSDNVEKIIDNLCKSDDPGSFLVVVFAAVIIGGLLMLLEYRPRN